MVSISSIIVVTGVSFIWGMVLTHMWLTAQNNRRSRHEIEEQLSRAIKDNQREPSDRTHGYIDALRWSLKLEGLDVDKFKEVDTHE